jgi:hypothetical protein
MKKGFERRLPDIKCPICGQDTIEWQFAAFQYDYVVLICKCREWHIYRVDVTLKIVVPEPIEKEGMQ